MVVRVNQKELIRQKAEADLVSFIRLVHPMRVLGSIHEELMRWWYREDSKSHQLTLLPRDHGKSAMVAYRVAWEITRNPSVRVLYISATANLATKQLKFIKDILLSPQYRLYWPEMVNEEESKREKWTETEISVDHPKRKAEAIRDPTIFTAGLTTGITGMHCDISVLDDIVVKENAYTEEGRNKVLAQYSLLTSIESADAVQWAVGTRYHPKDLYETMLTTTYEEYNSDGDILAEHSLYEVFERQVENCGDGTGEFLWPRQQRYDGKWFGFDLNILAKKRAAYQDKVQFRAQYYNDPNDRETASISQFQYYDKKHLNQIEGKWYLKGTRINVFAAVDFAYTINKKSDYSAICVVGVDSDRNYYVLDIDRFKTGKISDYFNHILSLHQKWGFRKLRAEITGAQEVIVNALKDNYIKPYGLALAVEESRPTRHMGTKEERVDAILQPRYENLQIWHYRGGNCQILEEELLLTNPSHDDVKDALSSAIDSAIAPTNTRHSTLNKNLSNFIHPRFGGVA